MRGNILAVRITGFSADEEEPVSELLDWSEWTHLEGFYAVWAPRGDRVEEPCWIAAGLEKGGTLLARPAFAAKALAGWSNLEGNPPQTHLHPRAEKGLNRRIRGFNGYPAPDVSF